MPSLMDRLQEKEVLGAIALGLLTYVILYFTTSLESFTIIIIAALFAGGCYLLYSDFVEKNRLKDAASAKEADLQRKILEQASLELESGKCVSCTATIPAGADKCPNCGYKVKHYTKTEN